MRVESSQRSRLPRDQSLYSLDHWGKRTVERKDRPNHLPASPLRKTLFLAKKKAAYRKRPWLCGRLRARFHVFPAFGIDVEGLRPAFDDLSIDHHLFHPFK